MVDVQKPLAFFDFDGTLIKGDSLFLYLCFQLKHSWRAWVQIPRLLRIFLQYKLRRYSAQDAKAAMIYRGTPTKEYAAWENSSLPFAKQLSKKNNPPVIDLLFQHLQQGDQVVILTAAAGDWVRAWAQYNGFSSVTILATELAWEQQRLTDRFATPNNAGLEKLKRIQQAFPSWREHETYGYGDSPSDLPFLSAMTYAYYKNFTRPATEQELVS